MRRSGLWFLALMLAGCTATPRVDVVSDIERITGIQGAIVIRCESDIDVTALPDPSALGQLEALRLVLRNDPRIQAAIAKVRAAEADSQQSRLLPNPVLSVDVRFPEGGGTQILEASLAGDLVSILGMPGRVKAADHRLRAAAADMLSTVLDIVAELQTAYVLAQSSDAQLEILGRRDTILRQLRDAATQRLTVGEGTRLDVLTLDAQLIELELETADTQLEQREQRFTLARLIGEPRGDGNWKLESSEGLSRVDAAEAAWIDVAMQSRPELQSRTWTLSALGEDAKLASLTPLEGGEIGVHGERDGSWVVGPMITTPLPIFDFGQAARAKAVAEHAAAYHDLAQQRAEVIEEIRRAYATCAINRDSLQAAQTRLLPVQEQLRAQATLSYRNGESDLTTLLLAETSYQQTLARVAEMQRKLALAIIRLERAAGGAAVAAKLEHASATASPSTTQSTANDGPTP